LLRRRLAARCGTWRAPLPSLAARQAQAEVLEAATDAAKQRQRLEDVRTAQLASLAETGDLAGLEKALGAAAAVAGAAAAREAASERLQRADTPPDPRRALMKEVRAAEWRRLTVPERDAALVINAMCKVRG
jgi:hypothetical protein